VTYGDEGEVPLRPAEDADVAEDAEDAEDADVVVGAEDADEVVVGADLGVGAVCRPMD
jgi:hypothetical protein